MEFEFKSPNAKNLKHCISLNDYGVSERYILWCEKNCLSEWGWFFEREIEISICYNYENQKAFMAFADINEALQFKLKIFKD